MAKLNLGRVVGFTPYIQGGYWYVNGVSSGVKAEGTDGKTPYIQTGYWYIDGTSTGIKAEGTDGVTPNIGMNGNWFIGATDTGVKAEGVNGISPSIGLNGNWYIGETDTGISATPLTEVGYSEMKSDLTGRVALASGAVDWNAGAIFTRTLSAATTLSFSNLKLNKVITLIITGNSKTLTFPASVKIMAGEYDDSTVNYIQLHCTNTSPAEVWCSISQEV